MRLYTVLGVSTGLWIVLGAYVFYEIRGTYRRQGTFTNRLLAAWYVMWAFHHVPVVLASLRSVWAIPIDSRLALTGGLTALVVGVVMLPMGMIEFRSLRRSTGQDTSTLITTGVYRWTRNPQFIGWSLVLLGVSTAGRSGFAMALAAAFMLVLHLYTVFLEEPYIESLHGEEYRRYRSHVPRYIGIPQKLKQTG